MKNKKRILSVSLCIVFAAMLMLTGCNKKEYQIDEGVTTYSTEATTKETSTEKQTTKKEEVTTKKQEPTTKKEEQTTKAPEIQTTAQTEQQTQQQATQQQTQSANQNNNNSNTTKPASQSGGEQVTTWSNPDKQTTHKHNYEARVTKDATCYSEGIMTYTCSYDGDSYTQTIPMIAHTFVPSTIKEATCGENGLISYDCSVCGSHQKNETIHATGNHNYIPVYKTQTVTKYICDCGQSFDSKDAWVSHSNLNGDGHLGCKTKQYSVDTDEVDYQKCSVCGQTK